ncbi:PIN-like domain-containing protein [Hymenobacter cellulosivorans]|uniref:PIN-like domain-containing protein n=1 Tax=Hymenobacter cellulosivorans TaxID=2932249 RepID=A0ABY4FE01_9BACT|nr:PIN-like domain-containing protein [Hymenobacter cellulosivorans]UOQ54765.1 PIN-like domain-containing protein [Hymenobacter cellulosivorans]
MPPIEINSAFSFKSDKDLTIGESRAALSVFADRFPQAVILKDEFEFLFLDTNVLLDYYGMSKSEKAKLLKFFQANIERIYLPYRVQVEFLSNRLGVIEKDLFNPLNQIHTDFITTRNNIKQKYSSYLESKKKILSNDFPELWNELDNIAKGLDKLIGDKEIDEKVKKAVNDSRAGYKDIEVVDELLELCSQFHLLEPLSANEIKLLEKQYNELATLLTNAKEGEKWKNVFPGSGDFGKKDYPYGDYIIFHEIIKFMKNNNSDSIFLTNEKSKGDWMQKDMRPIIRYVEKSYSLTSHVMFIIHAEEPLKISFENIHKPAQPESLLINHSGAHPNYTYFLEADHPLSVKSEALREFLSKYKEEAEFSYSTSEGVFSKIVVTAIIDGNDYDSSANPTLYIKPSTVFFEHTEEGITLKKIYESVLELQCDIDQVKKTGNNYVVFWRRSTKCKVMILEQFVEKYRHDWIRIENSFLGTRRAIDIIASGTTPTEILTIPINPSIKDESEVLEKAFELSRRKSTNSPTTDS